MELAHAWENGALVVWSTQLQRTRQYASCSTTARSLTGWVISVEGSALSWKSQEHTTVAVSMAVAEYMVACSVSK